MAGLTTRKKERNAPFVARNFHTGTEVRIRVIGMIAVVEVELVAPVRVRDVAVGERPVFLSVSVRITENLYQDFLRFLCWNLQAWCRNGQAVSLLRQIATKHF